MNEIQKATQKYSEQSAKAFAEFQDRIKSELGDELFAMATFEDTRYGAIAKIKDYGIEIDWESPVKNKWNARQYWISPANLKHSYPMSNYWDFCDCKWCDANNGELHQIALNMIARVNEFCIKNHKSKQLQRSINI